MKTLRQAILLILIALTPLFVRAQKGSSIVIHDNTSQANGGESATSGLRKEIESALNKNKPCVDVMDDEDIRNVMQSEKDRNTVEGGDPQQVMTDIANFMNASYVIGVSATPGVGGTTYTAFVMDQRGNTVARQSGTDAKQVAESIVKQMGSNLADNCDPHWEGVVKYEYNLSETKVTSDKGAMNTEVRNTKRTVTRTNTEQNKIIATLMPPKPGTPSKAMARVWMRGSILNEMKEETVGEAHCRMPGENPTWRGFNSKYSETLTRIVAGAGTLPIHISVDGDGNFSIVVETPGGNALGKVVYERSESRCGNEKSPEQNAISMEDIKVDPSSFDVTGKTGSKDELMGSKTSPDGKTKITWSLHLKKPKK